jgi:hypothetical protein
MIAGVISNNSTEQVTWVRSFVSGDKTKTFCIYDGPTPESSRRAATSNGLPVDSISEVTVLDPYFYAGLTTSSKGRETPIATDETVESVIFCR